MNNINGREVDSLVAKVDESLDLYSRANIGEMLGVAVDSIKESEATFELALTRLDEIKAELAHQHNALDGKIKDLQQVEQGFLTRKKQRYDDDAAELERKLDSPAMAQLVNTRERIAALTTEMAEAESQFAHGAIIPAVRDDVLRLEVLQSFGLRLDKVKGLSQDEVWQLIESLWAV